MSKAPELIRVVPNITEDSYELFEALWNSYYGEYCHNYRSLEEATNKDRAEIKALLEPLKKLGFVYTVNGLMTDDGELAGSGFQVNGQSAHHLIELALYRYNYNDRPFGRVEDYVPKELNVAGYRYTLAKSTPPTTEEQV